MTVKFEYTNEIGRKTEAEAYISSEFVFTSAPDSPVKTGLNGKLHPSVIPDVTYAKATSLVIDRIASEAILRGDVVRASAANSVSLGDSNTVQGDATVLGVALNDADVGDPIEVLILGIISDPLFTAFTANSILFLDELGGITDERPSGTTRKFLTVIGKSLGGEDILIDIQQPITLGA